MKAALIDFIQVTPAAAGDPDPWVSIRVIEAGLTNDVDFSEQPYLWLGSVTHGNSWSSGQYDVLVGIYEPYGDVYRFGYDGLASTGEMGILVTNLVDNPVTGAARSIVMRGKGSTCLRPRTGGVFTYTGSVTVEDGAYLTTQDLGALNKASRLVIRNSGRLVVKLVNGVLAETLAVEIDGTANLHVSGGGETPNLTIKGPVSGSGTIKVTDQGGVIFAGTNNTFTGSVVVANTTVASGTLVVGIGNGANYSWNGADVTGLSLPRHQLVLNTTADATFTGKLPTNGMVVKKGAGTVTLTRPIDRSAAAAARLPAFVVEGGALVRGAAEETPMTGAMSLAMGTTFDLGGIACASFCLPYGEGSLVNPAPGSTMLLVGSSTNTMEFAGTIEGDVRLENTGLTQWKATGDAVFTGDVALGNGQFVIDSFFVSTNTVAVDEGARLLFSADEYNRLRAMTGLAVDFWTTGLSSALAPSHQAYYSNCLDIVATRVPNIRTDMTLFGNGIHSGETSGSDATHPFAQVLGGEKNYFIALFHGYFYAETDGTYSFSIRADDNGALWVDDALVTKCAAGNSSVEVTGSKYLTRGWHPFRTMFGEETGWEVFIVKVKRPGDTGYIDFPPETLVAAIDQGTHLASLEGRGQIGLAEGGVWPAIDDMTGFTGSVLVNGSTAGDVGVLPLNSAQLSQDVDKDMFNGFWTIGMASSMIITNGARAVELTPGRANTKGAINTTDMITLGQPWSVSFNYSAVSPSSTYKGDGFFIGVHTAAASAHDGNYWGYNDNPQRISQGTAYGLQVYMYYNNYSQLVWVNNNNIYAAAGPVVTNNTLVKWNSITENPMRVTMSYDGTEKLVVSFRQGENEVAVTNALAGADFAAKYADGKARIGIWGSNGGNWARTLMEQLTFTSSGEVAAEPALGGELELRGGTVGVASGPAESLTLAATLRIAGPTTLDATESALACTATEWSFDLDRAGAALTVLGDATFPAAVSLDLQTTGEWPEVPRLLADFSGFAGSIPTFSISGEVPRSVRLFLSGGRLYVCRVSGTTIVIR